MSALVFFLAIVLVGTAIVAVLASMRRERDEEETIELESHQLDEARAREAVLAENLPLRSHEVQLPMGGGAEGWEAIQALQHERDEGAA